jgi:signal transduction histidine kinase
MTHFVGIQRDISQRKHLERQLLQAQKMHSIGTLAGGVAHEFNNLLAGISGYASLCMRDPVVSGHLGDYLQQIVNLSERAANLTRQLLTFARTPRLVRRPLPMEPLLRGAADLVTRTLQLQVQLNLHPNAADGSPLIVEADAGQIQQALVNLSLNAREALVEPAPIAFGLRHVVLNGTKAAFPENLPAGDYVLVEVVDTGCGMTPEVLNQALDPFYTTKDVGRGSGLGLPMVFGIVHAHQGSLAIDSTPGKGTTIAMYFPRASGHP